jgi:hypothetical protein
MSKMLGLCLNFLTTASPESPIMEILDQLHWSPRRRRTAEGLHGREGWRSISLGWFRLGRRKLGTWISMSDGESCESLNADWFGKPSNTMEPSLWIHSPGLGVTLMLRLGTTMSMVGWNVLGLQLVGVFFYKR